jgi:hypothetical protein
MLSIPASGQCQCGALTYELTGRPFVQYTCHCRECQRLSSSAFSTCIQMPAESVNITSGTAVTRTRDTDTNNRLTIWFCSACGSALYCQSSARLRIRTVFAGTLDNPERVEVTAHIWLKRKLPWVLIPKEHRAYETAGDWSSDYAHDMQRYKPSSD